MEFKSYKIYEIANKIFSGGTPDTRKEEYWNGNIKWLSSGETKSNFIYDTDKKISQIGVDKSSTRLALKGTIVIASAGQGYTRGQTSMLMNDMYINQSLICIECNKELVNNYYLHYLLKSQYNKLRFLSNENSSRGSLTTGIIKDYKVLIPEMKNQNKIVKILRDIDSKIELNNQMNNNLQEISSNLYKHYFIDNNDYEYEEKKLAEIASEVVTGKTPSTSKDEYWGGNIPFVTIPDMHSDVFTVNAERYLTEEGNNSQKKKLLPRNSIMVSCIATVGLVSINSSPSHTNQQINSIIIKNDYDLYFLYENMKTRTDELKGIGSSGTSTLNVNKGEFEKLIIKYPTKEVLLEFDKTVRPLFNKMEELQKENINLEQLRDTLLPKLMNGEIDLDNIEI